MAKSRAFTLDHETPNTFYLSRNGSRGRLEIEVWTTPDGGKTWAHRADSPRKPCGSSALYPFASALCPLTSAGKRLARRGSASG